MTFTMPSLALAGNAATSLLTPEQCRAVLDRVRFGHIAFTRQLHVESEPIVFTVADGWLYFRANTGLRAAIAINPWVVVSVVETLDATRLDATRNVSVVARGTCYATEHTGSATEDAAALRGILRLRRPEVAGVTRTSRSERTAIVFRMHVDYLLGRTIDHGWSAPASPDVTPRTRAVVSG